jgi:hypothetical protein
MRTLRLLQSVPPRPHCVRPTVPRSHLAFARAGRKCSASTPGVLRSGNSRAAKKPVESSRPLRCLGNPAVAAPGSRTPAGPTHQASTVRRRGPRLCQGRGLRAKENISGLHSQARPLAVYASQAGLLQRHARHASGCGPDSTGRDCLPAGFQRKVSGCSQLPFLLSQAILTQ